MYADNTLTPREAIRLCALGTLAESSGDARMHYDDLVYSVRYFISRISGPSLDLMGESIELLRFEGLVEAANDQRTSENPKLALTDEGRAALETLLKANIRAGTSDLNELIMALKFRFLNLLPFEDQNVQVEAFMDVCETELARLEDLKSHHQADNGYLSDWLNHDIQRLEARLDWLTEFQKTLG